MNSSRQSLIDTLKVESIIGGIGAVLLSLYFFAWTTYLGRTPSKEDLLSAAILSVITIALLFLAPYGTKELLKRRKKMSAGIVLAVWSLTISYTIILIPLAILHIYFFVKMVRQEKVEQIAAGQRR